MSWAGIAITAAKTAWDQIASKRPLLVVTLTFVGGLAAIAGAIATQSLFWPLIASGLIVGAVALVVVATRGRNKQRNPFNIHVPASIEVASDLYRIIPEITAAATPVDFVRLIQRHPHVLSNSAQVLLANLAELARAEGDQDIATIYEQHRVRLKSIREVGLKETFIPQRRTLERTLAAFVQCSTPADARRFYDEHPELQSEWCDQELAVLQEAAEKKGDQRQVERLKQRRALLRPIKDPPIHYVQRFLDRRQHFEPIFVTLLNVKSLDEGRRIVAEHPEVLSEEADRNLSHLVAFAEAAGQPRLLTRFNQLRRLLQLCREVGIETAFDRETFFSEEAQAGKLLYPATYEFDTPLGRIAYQGSDEEMLKALSYLSSLPKDWKPEEP